MNRTIVKYFDKNDLPVNNYQLASRAEVSYYDNKKNLLRVEFFIKTKNVSNK